MDEFIIQLQAELDKVKSKENINEDIDSLQGKLNELKLQATLDPKTVQNLAKEIEKVINHKIVISNIVVDTNQANKSGQIAGEEFNKGVSQGLNKSSNILNSFKKSLQNIGMGSKEIDSIADRINNLGVQIESLNQSHSVGKKDILSVNISGIDQYGQAIQLTQEYNFASGELIKTIDNVSTAQQKVGTSANSLKKAESVFADYSAKIAQFKSTNSNILSGLTTPLSDFENKLAGLKNGSSTIDDVVNSYKNLNAEASQITANLSAQFNKVDSAVRNIAKGSETIASLKADFKGLANAPKEVNSELAKCEKLLQNVKNIELQEGRTSNWSAAYKEWENSVDSLTAKLKVLKKEQSNVASTQVFKTSDLKKDNIAYMTKVSNTIKKQMAEIQKLSNAKGWQNFKVKGVEEADGKIKKLVLTITDAEGAIKKLNFQREKLQGNGKIQDGLMQTGDVQIIKTAAQAQEELASSTKKANDELAEQVHKIQLSIGDKGDTTTQIKTLSDSFTKLGFSADEVKTKMSGVDTELTTLRNLFNNGASDSAIISQFDKLKLSLNETQNDLKATRSEYSLLVSDQQRLSKANVIEAWNLKNKNAIQDVRSANEAYIVSLRDLNTEMTKVRFNEISDGFSRIKNQMTALGKISTAVKGQIAQASASLVSFVSLSRVVMRAVNWFTQMPSTVKTLDTALVDLKKTAKMSAQELEDFYYASNDVAKQMGVTTEEILNQASAWSRLGFNTAATATQMAKLSSQFALISPGLSVDDATSGLVSIMRAYDIDVSDVLDGIESKVNIIGNNLALSNANIVKMLQDSVSAMAESRNSLEETIALESAAYEIVQNESVGNGFKTLALRLRGMNEETEELDESLKTIKGDLYDLTGVSIMEDENTYKSTYQILKEVSEVWDSLTDSTRAEALELMFGKLRSNIGAAVLKNFEAAERAMDLMADSAGNADAELSVAMDSIEYKMNRLSETGTSVAQNLFQREDMKTVIDGFTSIAEVIDKVTEKLGLFGTLTAGVGLFAGIKNIGKCRMSVRIS